MKKLTRITALIGIAACAALAASAFAASASKTVPFKATYAGKATEKVSGQTVTALAKGAGTASVLKKSTISGTVKGTTANPPCSPFGGPGNDQEQHGKAQRDRPQLFAGLRGLGDRPEQHLTQGLGAGPGRHRQVQEGQGKDPSSPATTTALAEPSR